MYCRGKWTGSKFVDEQKMQRFQRKLKCSAYIGYILIFKRCKKSSQRLNLKFFIINLNSSVRSYQQSKQLDAEDFDLT